MQLSGGLSDLKMDTEQEAELDSDLFSNYDNQCDIKIYLLYIYYHYILAEMFEGDFNFFKTIDKVRKLKEQISAMPDEERKDAAEKTLTECWKAFLEMM